MFTWLRPNDLVWNYVVNNYLLGKDPPAFDVLFWNQDTVRLAAGLHRDFVRLALDNSLARAGRARGARHARSTSARRRSTATSSPASTDHIVPWENAYRSTQLLGGETRFVLSTSGHIQALVNPPADGVRSSYRVADEHPADAEACLEPAPRCRAAGGPTTTQWLADALGRAASPRPKRLGGGGHRALAKAPGTYVHAS